MTQLTRKCGRPHFCVNRTIPGVYDPLLCQSVATLGRLVATMTNLASPLTREEKLLLAEALRRAEVARDAVEDALVGLGRWLLVHVFQDDSTAALEGRCDNPVWPPIRIVRF